MDIVIKAAAAAIILSVCILLVNKSNKELGITVALAASAIMLFPAMKMLGSIIELFNNAIELTGLTPALFMPILKCTGIAIVVRLSTGLCKDAGQGSIASALELIGTAAALYTALPVITSLMDTINGLI